MSDRKHWAHVLFSIQAAGGGRERRLLFAPRIRDWWRAGAAKRLYCAPGSSPGNRGAFAHRGKSGPHRAGCRL